MNWSTVRLISLRSLLFAAVLCHRSEAIELTDVGLKYQRFFDNNYSILIDGPQKEEVVVFLNTDLLPGVFWHNRVHGTTTEAKYQLVGWEFELGAQVTPLLSVQYRHHSQHNLDTGNPFGTHFNVEDSVGFTLHLMPPKNGRSVLK